jgi:hypothetical protein
VRQQLDWFYAHRAKGWLVATAYYVVVVTTHDLVQRPALALQRGYGIEKIHYIIAAILAVVLVWIVRSIWSRVRDHNDSRWLIRTGLLLLGWSLLVFSALMVRSIESIHYIQYLLLMLALSAMLRKPLLAALIVALCGFADEAWQYWYLHPRAPYFDFNDVVMNITGMLQGAWLYAVFRPDAEIGSNRVRPVLIGWAGVLAVVLALLGSGAFTLYKLDSGIPLHRRVPPTAEKPVKYFNSNKWGNSWVRVHPYAGIGFLFLLPLAILGFPRPRNEDEPKA